jgi:hypothetical protein
MSEHERLVDTLIIKLTGNLIVSPQALDLCCFILGASLFGEALPADVKWMRTATLLVQAAPILGLIPFCVITLCLREC